MCPFARAEREGDLSRTEGARKQLEARAQGAEQALASAQAQIKELTGGHGHQLEMRLRSSRM